MKKTKSAKCTSPAKQTKSKKPSTIEQLLAVRGVARTSSKTIASSATSKGSYSAKISPKCHPQNNYTSPYRKAEKSPPYSRPQKAHT
ncbi:MAG TPA: hypothetical protein VGF20_11935, partial [Candidatus Acidoferrum sp.]